MWIVGLLFVFVLGLCINSSIGMMVSVRMNSS